MKPASCVNSCFLRIMYLFATPQIILEFILSWYVKLSAKVMPLDFALNSAISRRRTCWLVAFWLVRVNSIEPWYFMLYVILWSVLDAIDQDPGGYVSYHVLQFAVEWNAVEIVWQVKAELMWKVNSTSKKGAVKFVFTIQNAWVLMLGKGKFFKYDSYGLWDLINSLHMHSVLSFIYQVLNAWGWSVWRKHASCVEWSNKICCDWR